MTDTQPSAADDLSGTTWTDRYRRTIHVIGPAVDSPFGSDRWYVRYEESDRSTAAEGLIRSWTRVYDAEPGEDDPNVAPTGPELQRNWLRVAAEQAAMRAAEPAEVPLAGWEVERLRGQLADALTEIERLTAGREVEQEMLRNAASQLSELTQAAEFRVKQLDEARAKLAAIREAAEAGSSTTARKVLRILDAADGKRP